MHHQHIIRILIDLHTSRPQTWLVLGTPLFPPCRGIVFGVGIIDIGRQAFDGVFEGGEEWRFGIAGEEVSENWDSKVSSLTWRLASVGRQGDQCMRRPVRRALMG